MALGPQAAGDGDPANGRGRLSGIGLARPGRLRGPVSAVILPALTAALVLAGCVPGRNGPETADEDGDTTATPDTTAPAPLEIFLPDEEVFCNGQPQDGAEIRGALPGEPVVLTSEQPIELEGGVADDEGRLRLPWSCDPAEARLRWVITATGQTSGRRIDFILKGTAIDPRLGQELQVSVPNRDFVCDGERRSVGTISGAEPFEIVSFQSPTAGDINAADADGEGVLDLFWVCGFDQAGTTWDITATGNQSGRTGRFTLVGQAPADGPETELVVSLEENPFVCNGESRRFAKLSNFVPFEVVDFSSAEAGELLDGRADGLGELPIRWQCAPGDGGKTWTLTAMGIESGRQVSLTFSGAGPPPESVTELAIAFGENPFACDGASRQFAVIANFVPREFVDFSSPQAQQLRQGQADEAGNLPIRWQCGAGDVDAIWEVTATGASSGKAITFTITGAAPPP